jgi:uncharacterized membrane protein YhaH (DUF805 family)
MKQSNSMKPFFIILISLLTTLTAYGQTSHSHLDSLMHTNTSDTDKPDSFRTIILDTIQPDSLTAFLSHNDADKEEGLWGLVKAFWIQIVASIVIGIVIVYLCRDKYSMFKKPFSFKGRIGRREMLITSLIFLAVCFFVLSPFTNVIVQTFNIMEIYESILFILIYGMLIWVQFAQGAKRCHDIGLSGMAQLIPIFNLILFFKEGDKGANKYGENPKINVS